MKVGIIVGSIREGRLGEGIAKWVNDLAQGRDTGVEYELVDLKKFNVPLLESQLFRVQRTSSTTTRRSRNGPTQSILSMASSSSPLSTTTLYQALSRMHSTLLAASGSARLFPSSATVLPAAFALPRHGA